MEVAFGNLTGNQIIFIFSCKGNKHICSMAKRLKDSSAGPVSLNNNYGQLICNAHSRRLILFHNDNLVFTGQFTNQIISNLTCTNDDKLHNTFLSLTGSQRSQNQFVSFFDFHIGKSQDHMVFSHNAEDMSGISIFNFTNSASDYFAVSLQECKVNTLTHNMMCAEVHLGFNIPVFKLMHESVYGKFRRRNGYKPD